MNESKKWWESTTFYGAIMSIASVVATLFKVDLGDPIAWVTAITGIVGGVVAMIGRIKAVKRISP